MNDRVHAKLDVISDVICPWCYIGKARLGQALKLLNGEIDLDVQWRPFELNPKMPSEGVSRSEYYSRKFGSELGAEQIIANVTDNAHRDGLAMDYAQIARIPNTRNAHRLIGSSLVSSRQDELVDRLFRAYFAEGRNIGDPDVLADLAADADLNREDVSSFLATNEGADEVEAFEREIQNAGINGVPAFLYNGRYLLSGAQSAETIALSVKKAAAKGL